MRYGSPCWRAARKSTFSELIWFRVLCVFRGIVLSSGVSLVSGSTYFWHSYWSNVEQRKTQAAFVYC